MTKFIVPTLLLVFAVFLWSCDRDKNNPGYDYFPDMAYSKAYETYSPNPNFSDSTTFRTPVEGTVSREGEYYPYPRSEEGMLNAVKLSNPMLPDSLNLKRGKEVYENICLHCHGSAADGKGHLFTSGKYLFPPANLISAKIVTRTDGQMYHAITVGYGIMEPHGVIVRPNDRWKVILYIRSLQTKHNTTDSLK
jgi:mono/diheme cytochrome c family protein